MSVVVEAQYVLCEVNFLNIKLDIKKLVLDDMGLIHLTQHTKSGLF
jgi:hypothetical protein